MSEIWKPIEGTGGRYEVSNTGKVRSLNYKNTGKVAELRPAPDPKGYMKTMLPFNGRWKTIKIHRIVAEAFIPNPDNKPQVNHKNGIKTDNRAENLEWATNYDNAHHAINNGLFENSYKNTEKANNQRKISVAAIDSEGKYQAFSSIAEAGRILGVNRRHIQAVLKGTRKQAGGYKFNAIKEEVMP